MAQVARNSQGAYFSRAESTMAASTLQRTMQILADEAATLDSRRQALTSFRRMYLEGQKGTSSLKDEEICKLCSTLIDTSILEDDTLCIEACRTLDVILPESKTTDFDFFQSILQVNRKKRLKIFGTLNILKDETVALIANALSIIDFLNDCLISIQPTTMIWLLSENADNITLLKFLESKNLSESEEFEEKIVDLTMNFLCRLCTFASCGLNIKQFDLFIMEKVLPLAYMGYSKQRKSALLVLQQAVKTDLGLRVRSTYREIWDKFKCTLQSVYCKRMTLLVNNSNQDWATQWETSISLIGTDLHKGSGLVNSLLKVEELAFKSADPNRRQAFLSWKLLIDNFALDQRELATMRRIKLLCVPLNAKNSKTEMMVLTKMEVWWHLIYKIYPSLGECIDCILTPFLNLCLGPFGEKPLLLYKNESSISLGKKFLKTQIFAIDAFVQLILSIEDQTKIENSVIQEKLPNPVNSSIFESLHKIFIHSFGEIIVILGSLPEEESKTRLNLSTILWNTLIIRIEEYDKMKVVMYKELMNVVIELLKNPYTKIKIIQDFLTTVALKNFDNIALKTHFTESALMEVLQAFLHIDNFCCFTAEDFKSVELLIWHLIKPKNSKVYYPRTLELINKILNILDNAEKNIVLNKHATLQIWCSVARIVTKFIEDSQNFNEGTIIEHNFNTVEKIISFPFSVVFIEDHAQLKSIAETWRDLYKQFDFQAELIVTVKPNEVLNKISNIIILSLRKDNRCCDFAVICFDVLLSTVNYDSLPSDSVEDVPAFILLLKELVTQSLQKNSLLIEKILKTFSTFLLRISNCNLEKSTFYLKCIQPVITCMLCKAGNKRLEQEIANTWGTIVILFKKFDRSLNYELLNVYRETIRSAALHTNVAISSTALSIFDLKDFVDEKSKTVLVDIRKEVEKLFPGKNYNMNEKNFKMGKEKNQQAKPIGSFINRQIESPSTSKSIVQGGKENVSKNKVNYNELDSQDFVAINTEIKLDVSRLTDHQKEMLKMRRDDIPALYNELSVSHSQDSQELQQWFDAKSRKSSPVKHLEKVSNNNDISKTPSSTFKNLMQTLSSEKLNCNAQPMIDDSREVAANEKTGETLVASSIEDLEKKDEAAPVVAKKLDFESREEFPADPEQTSPSIIDNAKMRRRNTNDEANGSGIGQDINGRMTRSSMQPQQSKLRKSFSNEQLETRGKKRRNSESNSECILNIEREKRPRRDVTPDNLNSSGDSVKSNECSKTADFSKVEVEGKKITKRQLNEMSRLKIDMRFDPLPSRRSVGKSNDPVNDKKANADKLKEDRNYMLKETNNIKRRSIKSNTFIEKEDKLSNNNKSIGRKSLPGKTLQNACSKKKVENVDETQEEIVIEDVSTQVDTIDKSSDAVENIKVTTDDSSITEIKSSQDSDIVESSQEPTFNSKMDKVECFIKIKKMEVIQSLRSPEEKIERIDKTENVESVENVENVENAENVEKTGNVENIEICEKAVKDVETTSNDPENSPNLMIPITMETEKSNMAQLENNKKLENNSVSQMSSPKSTKPRIIRSKCLPTQGRAAQMLGLVTKQSLNEKFTVDPSKYAETALTEEVTIVPLAKKDKTLKECERVSSPSSGGGGSRQEKMFSNMNNSLKPPERCASPAIIMFCNLKNDGERISPKLDKNERDSDVDKEIFQTDTAYGDGSPNGTIRKELPLLEWSNANPPSLTASPSASILKRIQEVDVETPNRKKRVSFADPPVSREMGYEIMTESSSPPKLEKLPSSRSPISRKELKKHTKLRLIQMEQDRLDNESVQVISADKSNQLMIIEESANNSIDTAVTEVSQKLNLSTVIYETVINESEIVEAVNINSDTHSQDGDLFTDNNNASKNESIDAMKTSTQNDQNNSSIKLDSIDLSNILHKSDDNQHISLEDTVDVDNISSSLESIHNDKPTKTGSQQATDPGDTLPVTDSVFSNLPNSQETQSSVARLNEAENLDSTLPVYPSLISCVDCVESVSGDLVDPLFTNNLAKHFIVNSIRSVGDLAQLTERDVNRLPIKSPKISCVKKALSRFEERKDARKTPERRSTNVVSSSTPLGNKHYSNSTVKESSFDDLIKSAGSSNSNLDSISALYEGKRATKRCLTDNSVQTSPTKKFKRNDEDSCTKLMEVCDEEFLFNAFIERFDAEKILKGYKEKMKNKSEKELKKETLHKLGLSVVDDSEASFEASTKIVGLQKVLKQLPKIFDDDCEFYDNVLKMYNKKFKTTSILDGLGVSKVKQIITDRFSSKELLNILAEKLTEGDHVNDTNDLHIVLNKVPVNVMSDNIHSRDDFKTSDNLLKVILEKTPEGLSDIMKSTIVECLTTKLDVCELVDMYNRAVKAGIRKLQTK